ncbi:hypothetical protein SAMN04515667_2410 [Formosa sp. Hel1_31_208]|uniref:hypothetical protein n=1 Tax=Formosa sp. Hel1_31_208 TaxID=1798225 RepID=UPI00087A5039|nr:hypothetical protein [Formosa sp. Hel1_31_208]SDS54289.1 hypothetical protein SAMN04515667_2410 [Formosa sp. Hel1_31_208]
MQLSKILGVILIALSVFFLGLQFKGLELEAFGIKALAMLLLVVLYFSTVRVKHPLFILFLVFFTTAEVFNYFTYDYFPDEGETIDIYYIIGNVLFICAYLCLIARIFTIMNFRKALVKFPFQILLLFGLGIFVVYMITDLESSMFDLDYTYAVELFYNMVIMFLVSLALVNYMYKDSKKSMNLLIGCILIVFSEVIQIAYFYISNFDNTLNFVYSVFLVGAFVFFYFQWRLIDEPESIYNYSELEA